MKNKQRNWAIIAFLCFVPGFIGMTITLNWLAFFGLLSIFACFFSIANEKPESSLVKRNQMSELHKQYQDYKEGRRNNMFLLLAASTKEEANIFIDNFVLPEHQSKFRSILL